MVAEILRASRPLRIVSRVSSGVTAIPPGYGPQAAIESLALPATFVTPIREAAMSTRDERTAAAVVAEAAAMAEAGRYLDDQATAAALDRLDGVLQVIDVLIAARRITLEDASWLLPALGYEMPEAEDDA